MMNPRSLVRSHRLPAKRDGYVMLVALMLMAILSIIGASTLQIAGIDQRIASQNRKHMMVLNTASAGTEHARYTLTYEDPPNEGIDTFGDTWGDFVQVDEAETNFGGMAYTHNMGVYWVTATFHRCGNPPPGYSTELGNTSFRSDYWEMESTAQMQYLSGTGYTTLNETLATTSALIRKVKQGSCKVR